MSARDERLLRSGSRAQTAGRPGRAALSSDGGRWLGGGPDENEVLTTATGVILLLLLAALGATIVFIGQLLAEHLFLGFLLLGPVALKMASPGYRFIRYYRGDGAYVEKGPPWLPLRLTAPVVVLSTLGVFISGVVLLAVGPLHRDPWMLLHKVTFILWLAFTALHVIGHLPEVSRLLGIRAEVLQLPGIRTDLDRAAFADEHPGEDTPPTAAGETRAAGGSGSAGRLFLLGGSVLVGAILAIVLIPDYHAWLTLQPLLHHGVPH